MCVAELRMERSIDIRAETDNAQLSTPGLVPVSLYFSNYVNIILSSLTNVFISFVFFTFFRSLIQFPTDRAPSPLVRIYGARPQ